MSNPLVLKSATFRDLTQPEGSAFELSIPVDSGYSMTGKRVELTIRASRGSDRKKITASSDDDVITITDQLVVVNVPPSFGDDVTLADVQALETGAWQVDFRAGAGQPVAIRITGKIEWEGDLGND